MGDQSGVLTCFGVKRGNANVSDIPVYAGGMAVHIVL